MATERLGPHARLPELDRAVRDLLLAERDLTRTYTDWLRLPAVERHSRRVDVEVAERRVDAARESVVRWQSDQL